MGYYTRVLSKREDCPPFDELAQVLHAEHADVVLSIERGDSKLWMELMLDHADGWPIAEVERNAVGDGDLAEAEIMELLEELEDGVPVAAAAWLASFLGSVRVIYAFRHLSGTSRGGGFAALDTVFQAILGRGDAIFQADGEGFSNLDGYHVLGEFARYDAGTFPVAVLRDGEWVPFQLDVRNGEHRRAFLEGRVPDDAPPA